MLYVSFVFNDIKLSESPLIKTKSCRFAKSLKSILVWTELVKPLQKTEMPIHFYNVFLEM